MKTNNNWYKVLRHDGVVQYALKKDDVYYLGGSGFGIINFDAASVTPIEGCPPVRNAHTYVCFDGDSNNVFKAIVDKNNRWNGWEMPFIHASDVVRMMNYLSDGGDWITYAINNDVITITYVNDDFDETSVIYPTTIDGETYYYFGNEGWVFEVAKFNYEDEQ